jgi:hypothetical protein
MVTNLKTFFGQCVVCPSIYVFWYLQTFLKLSIILMRYKIDTSDKLAVKTKYLFHIEYKMGKMCDIQSIVKTTTKTIFLLIPNKDKADIGLDNKTNMCCFVQPDCEFESRSGEVYSIQHI